MDVNYRPFINKGRLTRRLHCLGDWKSDFSLLIVGVSSFLGLFMTPYDGL